MVEYNLPLFKKAQRFTYRLDIEENVPFEKFSKKYFQ